MYIIGAIIFFSILYFIVRGAVEDGTLNALIKYNRLKKDEKSENNKPS